MDIEKIIKDTNIKVSNYTPNFQKREWHLLLDARKDLANAWRVLHSQNSDMGAFLMRTIFEVNKMLCQKLDIPYRVVKRDTLAQSNFYIFANLEKIQHLEINDMLIFNVEKTLNEREKIALPSEFKISYEINICEMLLLHTQ